MKTLILVLSVALLCGSFLLSGCEKKEGEQSITDTVKEVVGTEVARKAQEVDKKVNETMKEEAKRLLQTNEGKEQENPGEEPKEGHE